MSDEIAFLDACDTADLIKSKDVTAVEVTETAIRRAERLQPTLNAFISMEAEMALAAALEVDEKIARGETVGALAGVSTTSNKSSKVVASVFGKFGIILSAITILSIIFII